MYGTHEHQYRICPYLHIQSHACMHCMQACLHAASSSGFQCECTRSCRVKDCWKGSMHKSSTHLESQLWDNFVSTFLAETLNMGGSHGYVPHMCMTSLPDLFDVPSDLCELAARRAQAQSTLRPRVKVKPVTENYGKPCVGSNPQRRSKP